MRSNTMGRLVNELGETRARYAALAARLDPKHVIAAEMVVRKALQMSQELEVSAADALRLLITTSRKIELTEGAGDGE